MSDTSPHRSPRSRPSVLSISAGDAVLLAGILTFIAVVLSLAFGGKMIPGGPFISVSGDVIPFVLLIAAMVYGRVGLRSSNVWVKIDAVVVILFATLGMGLVMFSVGLFWADPYARGELIRW